MSFCYRTFYTTQEKTTYYITKIRALDKIAVKEPPLVRLWIMSIIVKRFWDFCGLAQTQTYYAIH